MGKETKEAEIRYEVLRIGDLVQYLDPIPEDMVVIYAPGIVIELSGLNYVKVKWMDPDIKAGIYLRRELKLLSRVICTQKAPKKHCKR